LKALLHGVFLTLYQPVFKSFFGIIDIHCIKRLTHFSNF